MPYGEFQAMLAERRGEVPDPAPPMFSPCRHPYDWLRKDIGAVRNDRGLLITVQYTCAACDKKLGSEHRQLKGRK
jgi:hypothetical protein